MNVESATFEFLAEPPVPEWIIRVTATGTDFELGARRLCARVGDVPVEGVLENDDLSGFVGYLRSAPPNGAHLFVGYDPAHLDDTDVQFEGLPDA